VYLRVVARAGDGASALFVVDGVNAESGAPRWRLICDDRIGSVSRVERLDVSVLGVLSKARDGEGYASA
jgi:hypothetical protein